MMEIMEKGVKLFITCVVTSLLLIAFIGDAKSAPAGGGGGIIGEPLDDEDEGLHLIPGFFIIDLPGSDYTQRINSTQAVYVDQSQPSINKNSGVSGDILVVGKNEFEHKFYTFVRFDLTGELPSDAVIESARIWMYCNSDTEAEIQMWRIRQTWDEDRVTWNTRPRCFPFLMPTEESGLMPDGLITTITVGSHGPGWYGFSARSIVEDWLDGSYANYGVAFVRTGTFNDSISFDSDEDFSNKPYLVIGYSSESGPVSSSDPLPDEDILDDDEPCRITYTITPERPGSGDRVTIRATATDNLAMHYVTIAAADGRELAYRGSPDPEERPLSLTCNYITPPVYPPSISFSIYADDKGPPGCQLEAVNIEVSGDESPPDVEMTIDYPDMNAIPEWHRLLPGDNQVIEITVTAADPDGIRDLYISTSYGVLLDESFSTDFPPTLTRTVTCTNSNSSLTEFRYWASATDREMLSTRVDGETIEIGRPYQWNFGLPFANWGSTTETHPWEIMEWIFSADEVNNSSWDGRYWRANRIYENVIRTSGRGGHCYGMSVTSLELGGYLPSRIWPNYIQPGTAGDINNLDTTVPYTHDYIDVRQAGQYSEETLSVTRSQYWAQTLPLLAPPSTCLFPYLDDILDDIEGDLRRRTPGVISIGTHGSDGHAVVPWRVVPAEDCSSVTRVYVYDNNRNHASIHDDLDYGNPCHYPFLEFNVESGSSIHPHGWWRYDWDCGAPVDIWNHEIFYHSYGAVIGDAGQINYIASDVGVTDHDIPRGREYYWVSGSADIDLYAEDGEGRRTGYVDGELVVEIPGSFPIRPMAAAAEDYRPPQMFGLPVDMSLSLHAAGSSLEDGESGEYSVDVMTGDFVYTVRNKACNSETQDELLLEPGPGGGYFLRMSGGADDDYDIVIAYDGKDRLERRYLLEGLSSGDDGDFEVHVTEDKNSLVVSNCGEEPIEADLVTSSTESFDKHPDVKHKPESRAELRLKKGESVRATPESWSTGEAVGDIVLVYLVPEILVDLLPDIAGIQDTRSVHAGEEFLVDIWARNVRNLDTFDFELQVCRDTMLDIPSVEEGPFLGSLGGETLFLDYNVDTATVRLTGSLSGDDSETAPDGEGVIAHLKLKVVGEDTGETCAIKILQPKYWNNEGTEITPAAYGAEVTLSHTMRGDCTGPDGNYDGCVDVWDFIEFTDCWLRSKSNWPAFCPCYDTSGPAGVPDGAVNVWDFMVFTDNWLTCVGDESTAPSSGAPVKKSMIEPVRTIVDLAPDLPDYQDSKTIGRDTAFQVDIVLQNVHDLDTFDLKVMVSDPANIEIVKVAEGPFLKSLGGTTLFMSQGLDAGRVQITGSLKGGDPALAPEGEGVIARITLKMLSPTEDIGISLTDVGCWDAHLNRLPVTSGIAATIRPAVFNNSLLQSYPNPLTPETWLPFSLANKAHCVINIYSLSGQLVRVLDLGEKEAGMYTTKDGAKPAAYWDGKNEAGEKVASGVYLYQLQAGSFVSTRKMIVVK